MNKGDSVNVLNPTGEWVVAGNGEFLANNGDDTSRVQTAKGIVIDVPNESIDEPRYICNGCEEVCENLCGTVNAPSTEITYENLNVLAMADALKTEHRYL